MKTKILVPSLLSLLLLQACGGGGGGGGSFPQAAGAAAPAQPAAPANSAPADAGSVSSPFARGATARYQFLGIGTQTFGALSQSDQAASGAMTRLNDNTLSGTSATKDIAGDASFAIGRWVAGTVTRSSGAETLTGTDNRAYHYVALNALPALPTSGSATCDKGVFTAPTFVSGPTGTATRIGTATGSASVTFGASGAVVTGAVNVVVDGANGTASLNGTAVSPTSLAISGAFLSGGSGAAIQLGDHGAGAYVVAAGFAATLPSGARYVGIAKFRCA